MTKVVLFSCVAGVAALCPQTSAAARQVQVAASAVAEIRDPESVIVLRTKDMKPANIANTVQRKHAMSRSITKRQVRVDVEGRIVKGEVNVEIITVDVH